MDTWEEEDTRPLEDEQRCDPVTVSKQRFDALCKVTQALLCGRFDEESLALQVTTHDRFAQLEATVQALCQEFLRITGRRSRQRPGHSTR